jgi:hypothetical protein
MNLTFPQLLAGAVGALLIYCAITNQTPADVLRMTAGKQKLAPGTNITPMATGQASWGTTSGHSVDPTYHPPKR